uniref:Uncharacterized protein n=1 Tax=Arundo donax TaxID=35708 RepID=A0A0A9GQQ6_ARUDO
MQGYCFLFPSPKIPASRDDINQFVMLQN